jgi:putative transposase
LRDDFLDRPMNRAPTWTVRRSAACCAINVDGSATHGHHKTTWKKSPHRPCPPPNHAYLVTIVTAHREPCFTSFTQARIAVQCFHDKNVARHAQTLAFVVMPDHIHWLLQLEENGSLSGVVRLYKSKVSISLHRPVWQRGFHDHALRNDEDIHGIGCYIVANPLRSWLGQKR